MVIWHPNLAQAFIYYFLCFSSNLYFIDHLFFFQIHTIIKIPYNFRIINNRSIILQLPKHWLKSRNFQEECVFSAIELLSVHFAQWSYHISFPELATIPLIRLRKFQEKSVVESLQRVVKRFIDLVPFLMKKEFSVFLYLSP